MGGRGHLRPSRPIATLPLIGDLPLQQILVVQFVVLVLR